jgi:hypothetical protein
MTSETWFFIYCLFRTEEIAQSVHAGTAADTLLGPYFLPPRLTGAVDQSFHQNLLPELLQYVDLFMVHA